MTDRGDESEAIVRAWSEADDRAALSPGDRAMVSATTAVRALIVDLALRHVHDEELYDACAVLGRLIADEDGSPSLAATAIDRACAALGVTAPVWAAPARAALAEGFMRASLDGVRRSAQASWDFPASAVRLDATTIAIAAGHPSDDDEILAAWAGHAARRAACDGVRRALVSGPPKPRAALADALAIVGIACTEL